MHKRILMSLVFSIEWYISALKINLHFWERSSSVIHFSLRPSYARKNWDKKTEKAAIVANDIVAYVESDIRIWKLIQAEDICLSTVFCESKTLRVKTAKDRIVRYGNTKTANFIAVLEVMHKAANQKTVKKIDNLRAAATPWSQPFWIASSDERP